MLGINYMLVHLGVPFAELVLMVRINERVVLQKCMGYLGKKFVWMFGGYWYLYVLSGFSGMMSVKTDFVIVG